MINGAIHVFNNLCTAGTEDCNADDNFWRSLSNLDLNVDLPSRRRTTRRPPSTPSAPRQHRRVLGGLQAAPMRRAIVNGSVVFQDYCANNNFASGGFLADSQVSPAT